MSLKLASLWGGARDTYLPIKGGYIKDGTMSLFVPPVIPSLNVTGNMGEDLIDAAKVSLSFLRAHGAWVKESFGLLCDPRDRHDRDYIFSMDRLGVRSSGQSAGAAYAGSPSTCCCDLKMVSLSRY